LSARQLDLQASGPGDCSNIEAIANGELKMLNEAIKNRGSRSQPPLWLYGGSPLLNIVQKPATGPLLSVLVAVVFEGLHDQT
jgi:hypothetical protein